MRSYTLLALVSLALLFSACSSDEGQGPRPSPTRHNEACLAECRTDRCPEAAECYVKCDEYGTNPRAAACRSQCDIKHEFCNSACMNECDAMQPVSIL